MPNTNPFFIVPVLLRYPVVSSPFLLKDDFVYGQLLRLLFFTNGTRDRCQSVETFIRKS